MRKSRFSEEQMVAILREADRDSVPGVAKRHGLSEQTVYAWRKRFGMLQVDDVRRLNRLEHENNRLKKLVAERDLEIEVMKEINRKSGKRAGTPPAGCLRNEARPVATASLHATESGALSAQLPIEQGCQGRAGDRTNERTFGKVPTVRVSPRAYIPRS